MGKDFRDYLRNNDAEKNGSDTTDKGADKPVGNSSDNVQDILGRYGGMSSAQLLREFEKQAAANKQNGGVSEEQIRQFVNTVSPMLNPQQLTMMNELLKKL